MQRLISPRKFNDFVTRYTCFGYFLFIYFLLCQFIRQLFLSYFTVQLRYNYRESIKTINGTLPYDLNYFMLSHVGYKQRTITTRKY